MFTAKDYKSDQYVRWCPGCGDHAVISTLQKAMAEIGIPPHQIAVISGIGCSSRIPYYLSPYGFHTIHGRGAAVATGVKVAHPELCVWQATGDGDCLAIGGNHFIHSVRRNVDLNVLLFNNQIYGLTKGQYSPTSAKGFVTKSSPFGTVERPFVPAELVFGAGGTFFARALDVDLETSKKIMIEAVKHKGTSILEFLVNCVIFNNGVHGWIASKEDRADRLIVLEDGKPMIFGKERNKGLVLDGWNLKVVTIGENGVREEDILIHDAQTVDYTLHQKLATMQGPDMPIAMGVIRAVPCESYDEAVQNQMEEVQSKSKIKSFDDLLNSLEHIEI